MQLAAGSRGRWFALDANMHIGAFTGPYAARSTPVLDNLATQLTTEANHKPMRYLEIDTGSWSEAPPPWWARLLTRVLPSANPDFTSLYQQTRIWWLEVSESGTPTREIGFDEAGNALVIGPVGRNVGFLIDSSDDWSTASGDSQIVAERFDAIWNALLPRFAHIPSE